MAGVASARLAGIATLRCGMYPSAVARSGVAQEDVCRGLQLSD
jgi:hypothetical protein